MNLNKARDFYSAYFEGTLDDGLRQAFERAMAADSRVGAEYQQFARIMGEIKAMQAPVEVPADLHLKIRERVDAHIIAVERQSRTANRFFAWRPIAYGAVAALAIILTIASISSFQGGRNTATAGFAPTTDKAPTLAYSEGSLVLEFASAEKNAVTLTSVPDGRVIATRSLVGQEMKSPLVNSGETPVVVSVSFASNYPTLYVAVPGVKPQVAAEGSGTVLDLAAAVASRFAVPVVMQTNATAAEVTWKLDGTDAFEAVADELKALGWKGEVRESGLLWISQN